MDAYKKFIEKLPSKRYKKGEIILHQGVIPVNAFIVKKGVVRTYNITAQGDEKSISFDVINEVFPSAWVFEKAPYTLFYYQAFTDCELFVISREEYQKYLKANPVAAYEILDRRVNQSISYTLRVNALIQSNAHAKLIHNLHFLCLRFGKDVRQDRVAINLPLTQQELADFIGLTRETTALELKALKDRGVVSYSNRQYRVNTDKLNELLGEEYNPGLNLSEH
jgi:CRP-like cAMP-binding protein